MNLFLNKKIKYIDINNELIKFIKRKEFVKYKNKTPINTKDIVRLNNYVRSKILKTVYKTQNAK